MEVISMIVLVLVKKDIMKYVHDMKTVEEWDMVSQIILLYCVKLGWWGHG